MLPSALGGVNTNPCDPGPSSCRSSGVPDDLHAFMSDVLRDEPPISEADVDRMWAEEMALRDAERELSAELDRTIRLNVELSQLLAAEFPGLVAPGSAA